MAERKTRTNYRAVAGMTLVSLLLCGLFFPLLITGIAQVLFPAQANGEVVQLDGRPVGSVLIAQQFSSARFLHPRPAGDSASGVDPDIQLQDALAQVPRIHNATGIPSEAIDGIIAQHTEGTLWVFGTPYVNVLEVNLALVYAYPSVYNSTAA